MKHMMIGLALMASTAAFAQAEPGSEACYEVSRDGQSWSRTPELLCIKEAEGDNQYEISLRSGLPGMQTTHAVFNLSMVAAARCMDCNENVYGIINPSNSTFAGLKVQFHGTRDLRARTESGLVVIGGLTYHYRR